MKNHWPVILGVGVPALFLLTVLGIALFPRLGARPSHDILFTNSEDHYPQSDYINKIEEGKLVRYPNENVLVENAYDSDKQEYYPKRREPNPLKAPKIYRYSVKDQSLKELSFEEAEKLSLDAGPTSDDGFSVGHPGYGYNDGIFEIFGSRRSRAGQLPIYRDGKVVDEITLPANQDYYYYVDLTFLAWIK